MSTATRRLAYGLLFLTYITTGYTAATPAASNITATPPRNDTSPNNNTVSIPLTNRAKDEIGCYALPYGGLGFTSHVLTYLTVFCLSHGRTPLMPWRPLDGERFQWEEMRWFQHWQFQYWSYLKKVLRLPLFRGK